jgi:hypothetical protein
MLTCSTDRPWGLHAPVRSDEDCPRCGWTAPGPLGDFGGPPRQPDGDEPVPRPTPRMCARD